MSLQLDDLPAVRPVPADSVARAELSGGDLLVCAPESQSALVLDPVSAALFASLDGESTIAELSRDLAVLPAFGESAEGISRAQEQVVNLVTALSHHRLLDSPLDPGAPIKLRFPAVPPDS